MAGPNPMTVIEQTTMAIPFMVKYSFCFAESAGAFNIRISNEI
jgi:hypothetical protein